MMTSRDSRPRASTDGGEDVHVGVAEFGVSADGADLVTNGVGSCIAVALYDERATVGGLVHPMQPERTGNRGPDAKYVDPGIQRLLEALLHHGAGRRNVSAKLAGGASILSTTGGNIGERNADRAESCLTKLGVPVAATDLGGDQGRIVRFDSATGTMTVKRAHGKHLEL